MSADACSSSIAWLRSSSFCCAMSAVAAWIFRSSVLPEACFSWSYRQLPAFLPAVAFDEGVLPMDLTELAAEHLREPLLVGGHPHPGREQQQADRRVGVAGPERHGMERRVRERRRRPAAPLGGRARRGHVDRLADSAARAPAGCRDPRSGPRTRSPGPAGRTTRPPRDASRPRAGRGRSIGWRQGLPRTTSAPAARRPRSRSDGENPRGAAGGAPGGRRGRPPSPGPGRYCPARGGPVVRSSRRTGPGTRLERCAEDCPFASECLMRRLALRARASSGSGEGEGQVTRSNGGAIHPFGPSIATVHACSEARQ